LTEKLVAVVKPCLRVFFWRHRHAAESWTVVIPKAIIVEAGVEDSFRKGAKVAVYYDQKKKRLTYRLRRLR
jgi:hypothetical protein